MIIGIEGKVLKKELTKVHIKTSGLVYEVHVSLQCSNQIKEDPLFLHVTQIIREDHWSLYGFFDPNEKILFDTLIKINGVGPKVAMAICSTFTPQTFAGITHAKDAKALTAVPGIGPKSASRIMVELAGFILESEHGYTASDSQQEAFLALESLGFKADAIRKVLTSCKADTTSELVKEALKALQGLK